MVVLKTEGRRISDIKKIVNQVTETNITLIPNIDLEEILKEPKERIFLNQLIAMTTDMSERKSSQFCIVLEYGNLNLTKVKEKKMEVVLEQMLHQLEFTKVCMLINISPIKGKNLRDNIKSSHLLVRGLEEQLAVQV